jgi:hypothetical protein
MGPNHAAVDEVQVPVDEPGGVGLGLQCLQKALPDPGLAPAVEPARHRAAGAVALGHVTPRRAGAQNPQNAVEDGAMIVIGAARPRPLRGQQWRQKLPLLVRQLITLHVPSDGNPMAAGKPLCRHALVARTGSHDKA